jgi:hypothetical protein
LNDIIHKILLILSIFKIKSRREPFSYRVGR